MNVATPDSRTVGAFISPITSAGKTTEKTLEMGPMRVIQSPSHYINAELA